MGGTIRSGSFMDGRSGRGGMTHTRGGDDTLECKIRNAEDRQLFSEGDSDICKCGHNIHEHEAVGDCKCYVNGCPCDGFESEDSTRD